MLSRARVVWATRSDVAGMLKRTDVPLCRREQCTGRCQDVLLVVLL